MRRLFVALTFCVGIALVLAGLPARSALAQRATTDSNGAQDTIANGYLATIAAAVGSGASEATLAALNVLTGAVTETAPATDTASSGLNGRLQRIAQRVTILITAVGTPFQAGGSIGNTSFSAPVADGGNVTLGAKADAKASTSDATPITAMQVLKQISFSMQAAVTALGSPFQAGGSIGNSAFGATQSGTWTVQPGNTPNTTPWEVGLFATATTTDSALGCYLQSAASTNATNCKNSAGNFYGVRAVNTTGTLYYLRLYNASGTPTCSSATGFIESIPVPASTSGAGFNFPEVPPIGYTTGLAFCFTGGGSSTDNTNAATGVYLTLKYK